MRPNDMLDRKEQGAVELPADQRQQDYERPETIRVGSVGEVTQGSGTNRLDGSYGPGWTHYN